MTNPIEFLNTFKIELTQWIKYPTVSAPHDIILKIISATELAIELIETERKVTPIEMHFFEGGTYLVRYFDGWGDTFLEKYFIMVAHIKMNHYP